MKQEHDCPCCTCGQTELLWSDRISHVFLQDLESVARAVVGCSLDHNYDRTDTGVPDGIPDLWKQALIPVVSKHMSQIRVDWVDHSIKMTEDEKAGFLLEVTQILQIISKVDPQ